MRRTPVLCLCLCLCVALSTALRSASAAAGTLVNRALILDGSGAPGREGSLRIAGERIVAVAYAPETLAPLPGETVVDVHGLALAPGLHRHPHPRRRADSRASGGARRRQPGHHDARRRAGRRLDAAARASSSPASSASRRRSTSPRTPGTARFGRACSAPISGAPRLRPRSKRCARCSREEMAAGALGLSTGLEYDPGIYSATAEVVELAQGRGGLRRTLYQPCAQRGPRLLGGDRRDPGDRPRGAAPGADLAHQARHALALGGGAAPACAPRRGATQRRRRDRRHLSLSLLALGADRALSGERTSRVSRRPSSRCARLRRRRV